MLYIVLGFSTKSCLQSRTQLLGFFFKMPVLQDTLEASVLMQQEELDFLFI